ncbi:MAG TPA: DUF4097 family beta strand repeat-containing protein, partial [Acidobacteriaceae bacterium]|nr:DUF4097 family beta strand repeat-containing protein [Acidobacteriaceae bacterium]
MAVYPPPYSRRDARAQRRYWRAQRRPSILGPLLLIAVGTLALLVETGRLSGFQLWDWYARWWPLLLVAVGLISLGEWWFGRESPYGRHGYGGVVTLLVLLAIIAYANHGLRGFFGGHGDDLDFFHFFESRHEFDHTLNQAIPSAAFMNIESPRGDVTVTPSGDDQVHVQSHEVVYAANDKDAQRSLDRLRPQLIVVDKSVTLRAAGTNRGRADLTVEIPADATANISAGRGDVTAEDLKTPLQVNAGRGDVKLNRLKSGADTRLGRGDFTASTITGDVSLRGRLDDVAISDVTGRVLLDGDFFGDTHIAHASSQVHFRSSRTALEVANLPGDFSLDSGALQLNNAAGPIVISTRAKDIVCTEITGSARIDDANGEISLAVSGQPGEIRIENRNGAIQLTLPRDASFRLRATARNGNIQSDFDIPVESSGRGHTLSGVVGSGMAGIELIADHGDIRINRAESPAVPP